jgi:hypothetical protein
LIFGRISTLSSIECLKVYEWKLTAFNLLGFSILE